MPLIKSLTAKKKAAEEDSAATKAALTPEQKLSEIFERLKDEITSYKKELKTNERQLNELKESLYATMSTQLLNFQELLITALQISLPKNIMTAFIALITQSNFSDRISMQVTAILTKCRHKSRAQEKIKTGTKIAEALKIKDEDINAINLYGILTFLDADSTILQQIREIFIDSIMAAQPLVPILCIKGMQEKADAMLAAPAPGCEAYSDSETDSKRSANSRHSVASTLQSVSEEQSRFITEEEIYDLNALIEDEIEKEFADEIEEYSPKYNDPRLTSFEAPSSPTNSSL